MNDQIPTSRREQILDAARRVVEQQGVPQLTLEAVAAEAGVSKGGLLYHFSSKEALIEAMLAHFLDTFDAEVQEAYASLPEQQGRWLRAYVEVSFRSAEYQPTFIAAVLAAVASHPLLLRLLQARYQQWQEQAVADRVSLQTALLVMQATDGLWYAELLGLTRLDEAAREGMKAALLRLIDTNNDA